jgi:hypothetical protein
MIRLIVQDPIFLPMSGSLEAPSIGAGEMKSQSSVESSGLVYLSCSSLM